MSGSACDCTSCVVGEELLGIGEDVTMSVPKIRKKSKLYLNHKIGGVLYDSTPPKLLRGFLLSQFNSSLHQIRKFLLLLH